MEGLVVASVIGGVADDAGVEAGVRSSPLEASKRARRDGVRSVDDNVDAMRCESGGCGSESSSESSALPESEECSESESSSEAELSPESEMSSESDVASESVELSEFEDTSVVDVDERRGRGCARLTEREGPVARVLLLRGSSSSCDCD